MVALRICGRTPLSACAAASIDCPCLVRIITLSHHVERPSS
jgi:hypothetical protein